MRSVRRWGGLVGGIALVSTVTACFPQQACPAIGYGSSVVVTLEGAVDEVDLVEFCASRVCSTTLQLRTDPPLEVIESFPPESPEPAPTPQPPVYAAVQVDDRSWEFQILGGPAPERAIIRAISDGDMVLAERQVALEWVRVGGTERCGGPQQAGPFTLDV